MVLPVRFTAPARNDIQDVLTRSREQFGSNAERRYRALIQTALRDLAAEPARDGVRMVLGHAGTMSHPPGLSRSHVEPATEKVRMPRHVA